MPFETHRRSSLQVRSLAAHFFESRAAVWGTLGVTALCALALGFAASLNPQKEVSLPAHVPNTPATVEHISLDITVTREGAIRLEDTIVASFNKRGIQAMRRIYPAFPLNPVDLWPIMSSAAINYKDSRWGYTGKSNAPAAPTRENPRFQVFVLGNQHENQPAGLFSVTLVNTLENAIVRFTERQGAAAQYKEGFLFPVTMPLRVTTQKLKLAIHLPDNIEPNEVEILLSSGTAARDTPAQWLKVFPPPQSQPTQYEASVERVVTNKPELRGILRNVNPLPGDRALYVWVRWPYGSVASSALQKVDMAEGAKSEKGHPKSSDS